MLSYDYEVVFLPYEDEDRTDLVLEVYHNGDLIERISSDAHWTAALWFIHGLIVSGSSVMIRQVKYGVRDA